MRILTLSTLALATALSAGVASAQSVNPGVAQLAASAGVSPYAFTQSQLIRLVDAQRNNDAEEIAFILSQSSDNQVARSDMGGDAVSSDAQLAAAAGVAPGLYTVSELQRLITARTNNDDEAVAFILSGENREEANPASVVTPGEAQIANILGVDAADYTLAELTALYAERYGDRS